MCGAATSSNMLIIGRAIAGLGASGIINGGYNIVHAIVTPAKHSCTYWAPSKHHTCILIYNRSVSGNFGRLCTTWLASRTVGRRSFD